MLKQPPIQDNFRNVPPIQTVDPKLLEAKQRKANILFSLSITFNIFQILFSIGTAISMRDTSTPWTEGRVFGYLIGIVDIACLFTTFIFSLIASTAQSSINRSSSKKITLPIGIAWTLWVILSILAILIFTAPHN